MKDDKCKLGTKKCNYWSI